MTENTDGWTSECPTVPGEYEFKHRSNDKPESVTVYDASGKLLVQVAGGRGMLSAFHNFHFDPQWRPLKGVEGETPETDACYVRAGMMLANQVDELDKTCRSLETRLAESVRLNGQFLDELRADVEYWKKLSRDNGMWAADAEEKMDAWKGVAVRLVGFMPAHRAGCPTRMGRDMDECDGGLNEVVAELEALKKGKS